MQLEKEFMSDEPSEFLEEQLLDDEDMSLDFALEAETPEEEVPAMEETVEESEE